MPPLASAITLLLLSIQLVTDSTEWDPV